MKTIKLVIKTGLIRIIVEQFELDHASRRIKKFFKKSNALESQSLPLSDKILIEWPQISSNNLAIGLCIEQLSASLKASPVAYKMTSGGQFAKFVNKLKYKFSIFSSIGIESLLLFNLQVQNKIWNLACNIVSELNEPEDLTNLIYKDILIGDLIYDTYLTRFRTHTIDLNSNQLKQIVGEALRTVDLFLRYFNDNCVKSVVVSHSVYLYGIPARIATTLNLDVYIIQTESIFRLSKESPTPFLDSGFIREKISKLNREDQMQAEAISRLALSKRFRGDTVPELELSSGVAFQSSKTSQNIPIFKNNESLNVLIATHDFYDAPHCYGKTFYPDFYLWLLRLKELSKYTQYNWYVKIHPDARGAMINQVHDLFGSEKNFTILERNISHHDIIDQGLDVALTVHGTIAMEYPIFGVPVVNASRSNPHSEFNFCITPTDVSDYERIIMNLNTVKLPMDHDSIFLFHYIKNFFYPKSWIFKDVNKLYHDLRWEKTFTPQIYDYFLDSNNSFSVEDLKQVVHNFLNSREPRISKEMFNECG